MFGRGAWYGVRMSRPKIHQRLANPKVLQMGNCSINVVPRQVSSDQNLLVRLALVLFKY